MAPFAELVKTQVEKDRRANELGALRDERAARSAVLAAILNLPVHDAIRGLPVHRTKRLYPAAR